MSITYEPSWLWLAESSFDERQPVRSEQGLAMYGNTIALMKGTENSPRMGWKIIRGQAGAGSTVISGLGQWRGALLIAEIPGSNPATVFNLEFSLDGSTYFAGTNIAGTDLSTSGVPVHSFRFFDFASGAVVPVGPSFAMGGSGLITHMRITRTAGTGVMGYMMHLQGGFTVF